MDIAKIKAFDILEIVALDMGRDRGAKGMVRGSKETPEGLRYIIAFGPGDEDLYEASQLSATHAPTPSTIPLRAGQEYAIGSDDVVLTEARVMPGQSYRTIHLTGRTTDGRTVVATHDRPFAH